MSAGEYRYERGGIPRAIIWQISHLEKLKDLRLCHDDDEDFDNDEDDIASLVQSWAESNLAWLLDICANLPDLETIELRNLKEYVEVETVRAFKSEKKNLKWIKYS
ncbi:hypothetical protein BGZ94_004135 [Podila epigama]|nr:hypothetical protein BGZ94_004135 [Podila epigama]